jgi:WD40 repeat protein
MESTAELELEFKRITAQPQCNQNTAIAWSPHRRGLLATGGGGATVRCIHFWNSLTGELVQRVDTGSQVCNLAWSKYSSELASFLHNKMVLNFVLEMLFSAKVRILFYIRSRW